MARFWWGQKNEERKIHWMGWEKLCLPKCQGGLGFRDLNTYKTALLAKQGWRIFQNDDSLLHQIFKERYFPKSNFFENPFSHYPSYAWKSIQKVGCWLHNGCRWRIGDGTKAKIWTNPWKAWHNKENSSPLWIPMKGLLHYRHKY